jgi:TonB family protein
MKLKYSLLLIVILFFVIPTFAQQQNVQFFNKAGLRVKLSDSAYFTRKITEADSGSAKFKVVDTYRNGKIKLTGNSSQLEALVLEGHSIAYYPNGVKQQVADYKKGVIDGMYTRYYSSGAVLQTGEYKEGKIVGDLKDYFANGQLATLKKPIDRPANIGHAFYSQYLILASYDSTGKALVVNGNGYFVEHETGINLIDEEGYLQDGLREGEWKGIEKNKDSTIAFTEVFKKGLMITGTANISGKTFTYTSRIIEPEYKGGSQQFYNFLSHNIQYPLNARKNNITGSVYLSFWIEPDGSVTNAKVVRSPDAELGAEALRVVQQSPNWLPASQFGRPVRVQYTVPVNFSLRSSRE